MITKLVVQNFQSHKRSELEFSPRVNVIVGPSDSGKTALIRALRWLATNRPTGESFRSHWGGDTEVTVVLPEGTIRRARSDTENSYIVGDKELKAIGTEVPEEVSSLLGFAEVNLQSQFDRPFLLDNSPGEVAATFNQVAHLEVIDRARRNLDRWSRGISSKLAHLKQQRKAVLEDLRRYDYLDRMEAEVEVVEQLEQHVNSLRRSSEALSSVCKRVQRLRAEQEELSRIAELATSVNQALGLYAEKQQVLGSINQLRTLTDRIRKVRTEVEGLSSISALRERVARALEMKGRREEVAAKVRALNSTLLAIRRVQKGLSRIQAELEQAEERFHREMPPVCPLCGQEVRRR